MLRRGRAMQGGREVCWNAAAAQSHAGGLIRGGAGMLLHRRCTHQEAAHKGKFNGLWSWLLCRREGGVTAFKGGLVRGAQRADCRCHLAQQSSSHQHSVGHWVRRGLHGAMPAHGACQQGRNPHPAPRPRLPPRPQQRSRLQSGPPILPRWQAAVACSSGVRHGKDAVQGKGSIPLSESSWPTGGLCAAFATRLVGSRQCGEAAGGIAASGFPAAAARRQRRVHRQWLQHLRRNSTASRFSSSRKEWPGSQPGQLCRAWWDVAVVEPGG